MSAITLTLNEGTSQEAKVTLPADMTTPDKEQFLAVLRALLLPRFPEDGTWQQSLDIHLTEHLRDA